MLSTLYADFLRQEGFHLIGRLDYRLHVTVWWNSEHRLQVMVVTVGGLVLIKGDKSYHLKSVTAEGETWARDIGLLHDYLEAHFPELRISFSHFRDVPPGLAQGEVRRRMAVEAPTLPIPTVEQIAELQQQLRAKQQDIQGMDALMALSSTESDLLTGYVHHQTRMQQRQVDQLQDQLNRQQQRHGLFQHLQREYQQKGSAAVYAFSINSNVQFAEDPQQFQDALRAVVKELLDMHRYQVTQKLGGGRLNIQVAEAAEPVIAWIEEWFGGALSPMQMRKFSQAFDLLRTAAEEHTIVAPDEPIVVEGHVRHAEKHLTARIVSDVLHRLDKTDAAGHKAVLSPDTVPPEALPLFLGYRVDETGRMIEPVAFPLTQMIHLSISGTTGSGKSFLARALIEEASQHKTLSILVLDPRNQSIGILIPEDRPKILQQYEAFALKPQHARGFLFTYYAPGLPYAPPAPPDLATLATGRSIVSFKGLDDADRCALAGKILDSVFNACNAQESETPRLLILVDEAQLFTRKRLDESAKQAAADAERAIDKIAREGRKFGIILALVSQTMKDFSYELAAIRQMTTTKIFLRNSDREIEYAADILGDGRQLAQLPTATAIIHNANWGAIRVRVRPPFSKVYEPGDAAVRQLVGTVSRRTVSLSADARQMLSVIMEYRPQPDRPLNVSRAAELAGVSSKRKLSELLEELEQSGAISTRRLPDHGRPRIIELLSPPGSASRSL